jgi:hypothetical protein
VGEAVPAAGPCNPARAQAGGGDRGDPGPVGGRALHRSTPVRGYERHPGLAAYQQ